jgi:hypothetical protein
MTKKLPPKITTDDVDRVLADVAAARDALTDLIVLIAAGHCEDIPDAGGFARRCLNTSRLFSNATAIFLAREDAQRPALSKSTLPQVGVDP